MQCTDEMFEHFRDVVEKSKLMWDAMPAEARAKLDAMPKDNAKAEYDALWVNADKNGDDCLNEEEWLAYTQSIHDKVKADSGWAPDHDEALSKECYAKLIAWCPGETGLAKAALGTW